MTSFYAVDIVDRAGRVLGAITGALDVTDRAARLVGRISRGIVDSLNAGGRVVAPGIGVAIATTGAGVGGGVYEIYVSVAIGAGGAAGDAGNLELREGATVLAVLACPAPGSNVIGPIRRTNVGGTAYSVNATAAGTAGVPYAATIAATRIE